MSFSICQRAPCKISIHALREEGDPSKPGVQARREPISIHALREEGDCRSCWRHRTDQRFLSTPSARRATRIPRNSWLVTKFLSTPSARRATSGAFYRAYSPFISIHALREEGDGSVPLWSI